MSEKNIKIPDSDQTARHRYDEADENTSLNSEGATDTGRQTSNKSGKHSSAEKLAASRPEFGESPGAHEVPGAHGDGAGGEHSHRMNHATPRDKALQPK